MHRPDADDAFYVDMAVSAVDLPDLPLLARDTLHGRFDLPIHYPCVPAAQLRAVERRRLARHRHPGAVYVFHWLAAALAPALVPLAHAVLFRER